jgi:hypothetical protein
MCAVWRKEQRRRQPGGCSQRHIMPQAAPSFGQPRQISRLGLVSTKAGRQPRPASPSSRQHFHEATRARPPRRRRQRQERTPAAGSRARRRWETRRWQGSTGWQGTAAGLARRPLTRAYAAADTARDWKFSVRPYKRRPLSQTEPLSQTPTTTRSAATYATNAPSPAVLPAAAPTEAEAAAEEELRLSCI